MRLVVTLYEFFHHYFILNNVTSSFDQSRMENPIVTVEKNRMISLQYCFQYVRVYVSPTAKIIEKRGLDLNCKLKTGEARNQINV